MPDGERSVRFTFDGRPIAARPGQSVAAALLESGHAMLTRSSKYRRPRGVHCAAGHCPNCMLRVDGSANVRTCMVDVRPGMRVETEGSTARRVDVFRAIDRAGRLFPVGFQYRYFKRQNIAWRIWEGRLRDVAADTEIPPSFPVPPAERVTADLLVVGGGVAGIGAAAAAAEAGLRVVLATRRGLGGRRRSTLRRTEAEPGLRDAVRTVQEAPNVTVLAPATVVAAFGDRYVVDAGERAVEVAAGAAILATGAYERALPFAGNDRPGVMLTSALYRLACEDGVLGGRTAVVVASDDSAYPLVRQLVAAGVTVRLVLDTRSSAPAAPTGVETITGVTDLAVEGRRSVQALTFTGPGGRRRVRCEVVGMSGGWQPADELRYTATSDGEAVVVGERARPLDWSGWREGPPPVLPAVGAVAGTMAPGRALAEGTLAGAWVAAALDPAQRPAMERAAAALEGPAHG